MKIDALQPARRLSSCQGRLKEHRTTPAESFRPNGIGDYLVHYRRRHGSIVVIPRSNFYACMGLPFVTLTKQTWTSFFLLYIHATAQQIT